MSEQERKIRHEAIPQGAEGLYYNNGLYSEVIVYYDDEAVYFEHRGKDSGIVRFSFEMLETLRTVVEEEAHGQRDSHGKNIQRGYRSKSLLDAGEGEEGGERERRDHRRGRAFGALLARNG